MRKTTIILTMMAAVAAGAGAMTPQMVSNPANLKGKEYVNPIIHADYSDPDVVASPDGRTFTPVRYFNGDETHQGRHVRIGVDDFRILRVKLYRY